MTHFETTQNCRLLSGTLICALLVLLSSFTGAQVLDTESEEELSPRALRDFYPKGPNLTSEKQLVRFAFRVRNMREKRPRNFKPLSITTTLNCFNCLVQLCGLFFKTGRIE